MTKAQIELAPKMRENFLRPARHRIFKGGRGSGKTRGLATMSAVYVYKLAEAHREGLWLCSREHLNSLEESSLEEVKAAIRAVPWLNDYFDIGEKYIRTQNRRISYAFAGLRHNLDSIKSKAKILGNWTDEGENVSEYAWGKLVPTIREEESENWVSYNPEDEESATHVRFIQNQPDDCIVTEMNWQDNPWFPDVLNSERLADKKYRPDTYEHIWEGQFVSLTDAQIFRRYRKGVLDVPDNVVWFYGADWGFAQDPNAGLRCCIPEPGVLYIDCEVYEIGTPTEAVPALFSELTDVVKWPMRADNARPETIDYCRRHGLPKIRAAKKGKGSIEDGINFLKGFDVVIHPDCVNTYREFKRYTYKIDKQTGEILPVPEDKNNHLIDALRYAVEGLHRRGKIIEMPKPEEPATRRRYFQNDEDEDNWKVA